ncbi:MAG: diphthine--ammonia ligase [Thermoplasmata archaeon]|nr:MAG: diphthine--ammonia ligase [Thermoplasmata archaeon]
MSEKVLLTWSGGKDSALALYELRNYDDYEVAALLTTITKDYDRISMHGIRSELLERQVNSLGLPLEKVFITKNTTNEEYESIMKEVLLKYHKLGVNEVVFGDIFLEDIKRYRDENLSRIGMKGVYPIWGRDTKELAHNFIDLGFSAIVTCVDSELLAGDFVGRQYDREFLSDLPDSVDPCGENGEFHTFVYKGPVFKEPISIEKGDTVIRENRFYFCELLPKKRA